MLVSKIFNPFFSRTRISTKRIIYQFLFFSKALESSQIYSKLIIGGFCVNLCRNTGHTLTLVSVVTFVFYYAYTEC